MLITMKGRRQPFYSPPSFCSFSPTPDNAYRRGRDLMYLTLMQACRNLQGNCPLLVLLLWLCSISCRYNFKFAIYFLQWSQYAFSPMTCQSYSSIASISSDFLS